ncbi:hypothetical protein WT25_01820 [Burkholderia territorii]|nr:hypothetical protein WT25_01820 [Burkholderia territorii]
MQIAHIVLWQGRARRLILERSQYVAGEFRIATSGRPEAGLFEKFERTDIPMCGHGIQMFAQHGAVG